MVDTVDKKTRSRMMASVKAKDTKPEIEFRRRLFAAGFRYRLHRKDLPGTPDIVFPKYRAVMFVNGCFWHMHGCRLSKLPGTRTDWWKTKLERNRCRDLENITVLKKSGWRIIIIWECSFRRPGKNRSEAIDQIVERIKKFLVSARELIEVPSSADKTKSKGDQNDGT